ncbi:MAG: hypothetical protein ABIU84_04160, partial [Thermoanaerobaculia bacterium]
MNSRQLMMAAALILGSCKSEEKGVVDRLIDASDAVAYSREAISSVNAAVVDLAAGFASPAAWTRTGADFQLVGAGGTLTVSSTTGELRLEATAAFEASHVDLLRVGLRGL